ncbi:MAG TPA: hypothetical protein ENH94_04665 [Phycisphaerales bacterium]|nr:hypothetical protein [Phycisphaerales bacterium]
MVATETLIGTEQTTTCYGNNVEYEGDQRALYETCDAIVRMHLSLVKDMAMEVKNACPLNISFDDLVSAGVFGLINAIESYNSAEVAFEDYCKPAIRSSLLDAVRYAYWISNYQKVDEADFGGLN